MREFIIKIGDAPDISGGYTLMGKQKELVRCKDCAHLREDGYCTYNNHTQENREWFCADGERKEPGE